MKQIFLLLFALVFFTPSATFAHAGFEKTIGSVTAYITQTPTSPLVGEKVNFSITFKKSLNEPVTNTQLKIDIIKTFYGDESKDKIVDNLTYTTDGNGVINFQYEFPSEDYYDLEINLPQEVTGTNINTGFLVQPRTLKEKHNWLIWTSSSGLTGILIGFTIAKTLESYKPRTQ